MEYSLYSLQNVLSVAKVHPYYNNSIEYPLSRDALREHIKKEAADTSSDIAEWPLLRKKTLYNTIARLVDDIRPENTYRHAMYTSITGGGSGSKPLFFATDADENRNQRKQFGGLIKACGIIRDGDWALTIHTTGELYRALDLTLEVLENAGACVLGAANRMGLDDVVKLLIQYNVNILTGNSSQMVHLAGFISTHPDRAKLKLNKIIYTSEVLTVSQRRFIKAVLGDIKICSLLASAEAGPWAVCNPDITGEATESAADFIYDKRSMLLQVLPMSAAVEDSKDQTPLLQGERGIIVQTSLARLRNPLVRYVTGDIGSLHPLPEAARHLIPASEWPHLQVVRLEGRDKRFSFDWDGKYFDFEELTAIMNEPKYSLLHWQVILDVAQTGGCESLLEIRLLSAASSHLRQELAARVKAFVHAVETNEYKFKLFFVTDVDELERSDTGGKVIKFVNRCS
ncbi:hypothetical protein VHEMI09699 [[Torrubiella] hemipterigena]|uniref:AMP-dependent synthetase/ligase domain-containing protein n=1 Tax=[Torrubiella] hemipterigena TaxID=1531966 RepID=A0A0A1TH03_9HYPO|nr:hypothetical protein VHEMI09699 [[Torrubiella] hemipterigena]